MTLLEDREATRTGERLRLYGATRVQLREALRATAAGHEFRLFGSLVHPGQFNSASDVDLAFTTLPAGRTEYELGADLEERLGRPVDLVDYNHTRLRTKIEREGERWIA